MKQYLAVDSGGTKVLAILYDEAFHPIRSARAGSMRDNTTARDLVLRNADQLIDDLGIGGQTISLLTGVWDGGLSERLNARCTVEKSIGCGELDEGFYAAGIIGNGYLALSGTGATLFARYEGKAYYCGGFGAAVADEGSGYWMSRNAFNAAIKDWEGRGPYTLLTQLIAEELGFPRERLNNAIFSIYGQNVYSPTARVASCAPLVSRAAEMGDAVAQELLRETGAALADQLIHMSMREGLPKDMPVTISGSVWKSHPLLFNTFSGKIREYGLPAVTVPPFEPIIGAIVRHYYEEHGVFGDEEMALFKRLYADFSYSIPAVQ